MDASKIFHPNELAPGIAISPPRFASFQPLYLVAVWFYTKDTGMSLNGNRLDEFEAGTHFPGEKRQKENYFVPFDGMTNYKGHTVDCKVD
jgi:hypothetical protein